MKDLVLEIKLVPIKKIVTILVFLWPALVFAQIFPRHLKDDKLEGRVKRLTVVTNDETSETFMYNEKGYQTEQWFFKPAGVLIYRYKAIYNDKGQILEETKFEKGITPVMRYVYGYNEKGSMIGRSLFSQNNSLLEKHIYVYDTAGRRTDSILFNQYENMSERYSWQYDAKGRMTRQTRSKPHAVSLVVEYEYNDSGQLSEEKHFSDGNLDNSVQYSYNGKEEERRSFDGKNKIKTIAILDSNKNVISIIFMENGKLRTKFSHLFDRSGNLLEEIVKDSTGNTISRLTYQYDSMNNQVEIKRYFVNDKLGTAVTWQYEYDKTGNWTRKTQFSNGIPREIVKREIEYY